MEKRIKQQHEIWLKYITRKQSSFAISVRACTQTCIHSGVFQHEHLGWYLGTFLVIVLFLYYSSNLEHVCVSHSKETLGRGLGQQRKIPDDFSILFYG